MQDPNEDTEWNDLLRSRGILPKKEPEVTEEQLTHLIEQTIEEKKSAESRLGALTLDQLDELEDDEDEAVILEYRRKRLQELKAQAKLEQYGEVEEITAKDYVSKVNEAGKGVWVILHLYKVKFLKAISTTCIPNFPDYNLPAIFVYFEGTIKRQFIGPHEFGNDKLKYNDLEWILSQTGAIKTDLEEDPRGPRIQNVLHSHLGINDENSDDENDW